MSLIIKLLPRDLPAFVRETVLSELFQATASAFGCPLPLLGDLPLDVYLQSYALFTRQQAENALNTGVDIASIKARLYQNAYPLGEKLRKRFGVHSTADVLALAAVIYHAIGVDIQSNEDCVILVRRCYFSHFYSSPVCDLISALDDGVFGGLSAGGRLAFEYRLTEGREFCKAVLKTGHVRERGQLA